MMGNQSKSADGGSRPLPAPLRVVTILGLVLVGVGVIALVGEKLTGSDRHAVEVTLPAGTTFVATLEQTVSTERAEVGDRVSLTTSEPLEAGPGVVLPAGLKVEGEVTHSKDGGRVAGAPELTIRFTSMEIDGEAVRLQSEPLRLKGKDDLGESAKQVGGGTVAGAVVGAIAGNVARGAILGAAVGTAVAVATDGEHIVLPVGQKLRVRLAEDLSVKYDTRKAADPE